MIAGILAGLVFFSLFAGQLPLVWLAAVCLGVVLFFLLAGGQKGKRYILPNAEVMIHQPLGGAQGQASDIQITAEHILKTKERLNRILSDNTGKPLDIIEKDTDRDNWLTADEAVAYGLVDQIITKK